MAATARLSIQTVIALLVCAALAAFGACDGVSNPTPHPVDPDKGEQGPTSTPDDEPEPTTSGGGTGEGDEATDPPSEPVDSDGDGIADDLGSEMPNLDLDAGPTDGQSEDGSVPPADLDGGATGDGGDEVDDGGPLDGGDDESEPESDDDQDGDAAPEPGAAAA